MSFKSVQSAFVTHIKSPDSEKSPLISDLEERRLNIYRELFFNNIEGFVSAAFPVLKSLYTPSSWQTLIRQFFIQHDCHSPYFLEISREFLTFLQTTYTPSSQDPVFLIELAHYEWLELDVASCIEDKDEQYVRPEALITSSLCLSSQARLATYSYPVHQIQQDYQPDTPSGPYSFILQRDEDDEVQFIAINPMTGLLLGLIESTSEQSLSFYVQQVSEQVPNLSISQLLEGAQQTLSAFAQKGIIVSKNPR